jgi:hypothetical protein
LASPARRARVAFGLFLGLAGLYLVTSSGRVRTPDEYMAFFQTESLVQRGNTAVPQAVQAGNFYGRFDPRGEPRAPYPPGQAIASVPFYLLGEGIASLPGVPAGARWAALRAGVGFGSALFAAAAVALFFFVSWHLAESIGPALAAAAALAISTLLLPYAGYLFSEPLAIAVSMAAAAVLLTGPTDRPLASGRAALAGVLVGAGVWIRFTHAIALPVFVLAALARRPRAARSALILAAAAAGVTLGVLAYNHAVWGHAFASGYPEQAEGGRALNTFHTPWYVGLAGFLFSPGKSILLFAPPVLFAVGALPALRARDAGAAVLAALMPLAYLAVFMTYTQWEGGYCIGPRYLLPAVPFLCLALGPGLARATKATRAAFVGLAVVGLVVQTVSAATSFLEDQAAALRYYDAAWSYRFGYTPMVSQGRLLWRYLTSPTPAPLGLGFDRWWIFLGRAGVEARTLLVMGAVPLALLALSALAGARFLLDPGQGLRVRPPNPGGGST